MLCRWLLGSMLLATCAGAAPAAAAPSPAPAEAGRPTLAILYFDYAGRDPALAPLREGLAQMFVSDFAGLPAVRVVERARVGALFEEQKLGRSGRVDSATAARAGRVLGARFVVLGSFFDLKDVLRVDARVVDVETGQILGAVGANGPAADVWSLERALADKIGQILDQRLPTAFREARARAPRPRPITVKSSTVATYGRALAALDVGKKTEARALLKEVVKDAPDFRLATTDLDALMR